LASDYDYTIRWSEETTPVSCPVFAEEALLIICRGLPLSRKPVYFGKYENYGMRML